MKLLITTLNSKFSHMALGARYIRNYLKPIEQIDIHLKEYTINQQMDWILSDIYKGQYDLILLSVYVWNLEQTLLLIKNLKKIQPHLKIILGGPEVSYETHDLMNKVTEIDYIVMGEGEATTYAFISALVNDDDLSKVRGLAYRSHDEVIVNPSRSLMKELEQIPFPYDETDDFDNRLVYYESQRGCPYNCAYCMSSTFKGVRFFPVERVKKDLKWFMDKEVRIVKFVDRTFNIKKDHFFEIMKYLHKIDNGVTSFHFEITASLLDQETLDFLSQVREGQFQFEIGVQSTNEPTLKAINRHHDLKKLYDNVRLLKSYGNIHLHLDLIAGLPHENYDRFLQSFNDVFKLDPDVIQLGFLKLLKGSELRQKEDEFGYVYRSYPPYEVLSSHVLNYADLDKLNKIEDLLDKFYNSHKFNHAIAYLCSLYKTPSELYEDLYEYWIKNDYYDAPTSFPNLYKRLFVFGQMLSGCNMRVLGNTLKMDMLIQKSTKVQDVLPDFYDPLRKSICHDVLRNNELRNGTFSHYHDLTAKQIVKRTHFEIFTDPDGNKTIMLFDYGVDGEKTAKDVTAIVNEIMDQTLIDE